MFEKKTTSRWTRTLALALLCLFVWTSGTLAAEPDKSKALERLDAYAAKMLENRPFLVGYPINQDTHMKEFYEWYLKSGLYDASMNNVGDPRKGTTLILNTHEFENEVIDYFAPQFGFSPGNYWGFVTASGTDGNLHGMYFGKKVLAGKSDLPPIVYVSDEAHYSIKKLADVLGMELRLIKSQPMGQMDLTEFKAKLDPKRPALVVVALGTTFKGAIDDQNAINAILAEANPPAVYRHLDAALFGSILGFLSDEVNDLVDAGKTHFDSIAVSGHKFWGFDEPMGIFISTMTVRNSINPFKVEYLKDAVPTVTCSRNALGALKFWWKITFTPKETFEKEAQTLLENARYLYDKLKERNIKAWLNENSNTVFFQRPGDEIMNKYNLAPDVSPDFGDLAHLIVMQHVTKDIINTFVAEMDKDINKK